MCALTHPIFSENGVGKSEHIARARALRSTGYPTKMGWVRARIIFRVSFEIMDSRPELRELQEHVRTNKWFDLGLQLGLKDNELAKIEVEHRGKIDDCRRDMFREWLRATTPEATRKQLIDALNSKAVSEISIAREYQKYVDPQFSQETQPATLGM